MARAASGLHLLLMSSSFFVNQYLGEGRIWPYYLMLDAPRSGTRILAPQPALERTRTPLHSAVLRCTPLCSLPSYSRGARRTLLSCSEKTLDKHRLSFLPVAAVACR